MPVTDVRKDLDALTLTVTSRFEAPPARVWQVWEDPRQLERWWGPPTHPATVVDHDLRPGGVVTYHMTGPEGDKYPGWWRIQAVEAPHRLEFADGFGAEPGLTTAELPSTLAVVRLVEDGAGTTMTIESRFASPEALRTVLAMGMEEGLRQALGQVDALLAT